MLSFINILNDNGINNQVHLLKTILEAVQCVLLLDQEISNLSSVESMSGQSILQLAESFDVPLSSVVKDRQ